MYVRGREGEKEREREREREKERERGREREGGRERERENERGEAVLASITYYHTDIHPLTTLDTQL